MQSRYKLPIALLVLVCLTAIGVTADAATVERRNIGELIAMGDVIIFGTVSNVRDGFDANNVPYTEVTVTVRESHKGDVGSSYTFRQFGLIEPRDMGNGTVNLNVTPDGWPTYSQGEDVALFLWRAAEWTGLRTTVGLFQGKFTIRDGQVTNIIDNEGLFNKVSVDRSKLSDKEAQMMDMTHGKMSEEVFTSFVRKAVNQRWFKDLEIGE